MVQGLYNLLKSQNNNPIDMHLSYVNKPRALTPPPTFGNSTYLEVRHVLRAKRTLDSQAFGTGIAIGRALLHW